MKETGKISLGRSTKEYSVLFIKEPQEKKTAERTENLINQQLICQPLILDRYQETLNHSRIPNYCPRVDILPHYVSEFLNEFLDISVCPWLKSPLYKAGENTS